MHYGDHAPPHIRAIYGDDEALVRFDGFLLQGRLPRRALGLVRIWIDLHQRDLADAWRRASRYESIGRIDPLP